MHTRIIAERIAKAGMQDAQQTPFEDLERLAFGSAHSPLISPHGNEIMSTIEDSNKALVRHIYEDSATDPNALARAMHEDFVEYVPPILPWGGVHHGFEDFTKKVMPLVAAALDLGSLRLVSLSADGDRVAALISARTRSGKELWIAEHWTLHDGKVTSLMVFYHDTIPLLEDAAAGS